MGHIRAKSNVTPPSVVKTPRGYRIIAIVFTLWLCFRSLSQYDWSVPHWKPPKNDSEWPEEPVVKNRRMALVIPINIPSPNVCKTILSATVLGYPAPIILNWKENHQDISHWELGRCLPKIPGMVHYLDAVMHPNATDLEKLEEDDLVLMVDGRDVWFQLPVEIVISRYHEINRRANERLRKQWKGKGPMPMKQTIVAASERNCYPNDPELFGVDLRCDIWPESPLRPDLYGPKTDKNISDFQHTRPRWINGGMYIGPAGDMRRFFRRAMEKMDAYIGEAFPLRSEQGMFGYLMGQQEVWRQYQRENHMKDLDLKDLIEENLEWHAGLDYGMEIANQVAYILPLTPQDVGVEYEWEEIVDLLNEWVEDEKYIQNLPSRLGYALSFESTLAAMQDANVDVLFRDWLWRQLCIQSRAYAPWDMAMPIHQQDWNFNNLKAAPSASERFNLRNSNAVMGY